MLISYKWAYLEYRWGSLEYQWSLLRPFEISNLVYLEKNLGRIAQNCSELNGVLISTGVLRLPKAMIKLPLHKTRFKTETNKQLKKDKITPEASSSLVSLSQHPHSPASSCLCPSSPYGQTVTLEHALFPNSSSTRQDPVIKWRFSYVPGLDNYILQAMRIWVLKHHSNWFFISTWKHLLTQFIHQIIVEKVTTRKVIVLKYRGELISGSVTSEHGNIVKKKVYQTSMVVQWLRLHASTSGDMGLMPGQWN